MSPARVLFLAEAVTVTHIGRMLHLARGLDRTRFTPLLAWHPRFNRLLGRLDEEFYPLYSIGSDTFLRKLYQTKPVYDFETLERYIAWDLEILREARPDVVVGDYRLSLPISAGFAGVPFINVINAHWSPHARPEFRVPESPVTRALGPALPQFFFKALRPIFFRLYAADFNRLNRKFGRPSFGPDLRQIYCFGDRVLYPDLAEIVPVRDLPPRHRFLGPVVWSPDLPVPAGIDGRLPGQKTAYVNLGTSGNAALLPEVVRSLTSRGWRVLVATGNSPVALPPAPDVHVMNFVSGDAACRAADLVVFNGGSAGGHQAMLAGVPVLGIPSNMDQFLNMYFVEKAGLGVMVRPEGLTAARVGAAVDRLAADPAYVRRAQEMARAAERYRPVQVLEETLAEVLAGRTLLSPPQAPTPPRSAVAVPPAAIQRIVEACVLAPSVGNSQPFRYSWDGEKLSVHLVPDRANPFLNFLNPDTWLCLGAILMNLRVAAAAEGYSVEVSLLLQGGKDGVAAYAAFAPGAAPEGALAPFLAERCTNRRSHDERPLSDEARAALSAAAAAYPMVKLDWVTAPAKKNVVAEAMSVYNRILFENDGLLSSFLKWLRRSPEEAERTRDGLSLPSLEIGRSGWLFLFAASSARAAILSKVGFYRFFSRFTRHQVARSGAFGLLSIPMSDTADIVRAGEAMEAIWLTAARLGLAFQPLAGILMLMSRVRFSGGAGLSPAHQRLTVRMMANLGRLFPGFDGGLPVIFFRVGHAPPPTARSGRRPLEDVFDKLA